MQLCKEINNGTYQVVNAKLEKIATLFGNLK